MHYVKKNVILEILSKILLGTTLSFPNFGCDLSLWSLCKLTPLLDIYTLTSNMKLLHILNAVMHIQHYSIKLNLLFYIYVFNCPLKDVSEAFCWQHTACVVPFCRTSYIFLWTTFHRPAKNNLGKLS